MAVEGFAILVVDRLTEDEEEEGEAKTDVGKPKKTDLDKWDVVNEDVDGTMVLNEIGTTVLVGSPGTECGIDVKSVCTGISLLCLCFSRGDTGLETLASLSFSDRFANELAGYVRRSLDLTDVSECVGEFGNAPIVKSLDSSSGSGFSVLLVVGVLC